MPKRTTITIPDDILGACEQWQEERWALLRHRPGVTDALIALARLGAEGTGLLAPYKPKPKKGKA